MKKNCICICTIFFILQLFCPVLATEIWYEDNNGGGSEQGFFIKKGFVTKFNKLETFINALKNINVYMVSAPLLMQKPVTDKFLTEVFYPVLKKNNIKLALDAPGAMFLQSGGKDRDNKAFLRDISQLARLKKLGIEVSYISLQSVLSKPLLSNGKPIYYSMDNRIQDVVDFSESVKKIYPNIEIGLIDALFSHGDEYKNPLIKVTEALINKGIKLSYLHLDIPFETIKESKNNITWDKVKEFESFVEKVLNIKFGMIAFSNLGGHISNKMYHQGVVSSFECYSTIGGTPAAYVIMAWFPYPDKVIPENDTGDDYPAMRTVLKFGNELKNNKTLTKNLWIDKCTNGIY